MKKKAIIILLTFLLLVPGQVMAINFVDLGSDHWAKGHIEKLAGEKILNGYPDGTFKPDKYVSLLEIMSILKGLVNPSQEEIDAATKLYSRVAQMYKIQDWAKEAFCISLYKNIVYESELAKANKNGLITDVPKENQYPSREYIAVLYGRALEVSPSYDHSNLKYKDMNQIGKAIGSDLDVADYLSALVKIGVFDPEGSEGNFEPTRPFRRSEVAKITDLSYDYVNK